MDSKDGKNGGSLNFKCDKEYQARWVQALSFYWKRSTPWIFKTIGRTRSLANRKPKAFNDAQLNDISSIETMPMSTLDIEPSSFLCNTKKNSETPISVRMFCGQIPFLLVKSNGYSSCA